MLEQSPLSLEDRPDGRVQRRLFEPVGQPTVLHDGRHAGRRSLEILERGGFLSKPGTLDRKFQVSYYLSTCVTIQTSSKLLEYWCFQKFF